MVTYLLTSLHLLGLVPCGLVHIPALKALDTLTMLWT